MQAFHLSQPTSLDAAVTAASTHGAKFIAGGTDLMQLLRTMSRRQPNWSTWSMSVLPSSRLMRRDYEWVRWHG